MKILITIFSISIFTVCSFAQLSYDKTTITLQNDQSLRSALSSPYTLSDAYAKKKNDFSFSTNVYFWGVGMSGSMAIPADIPALGLTQTPVVDVSMSFSDAVKYMKFAIMLAGRFNYKSYGLLYDVAYANLGHGGSVPASSNFQSGNVNLKLFNGDFAVLYNIPFKESDTKFSCFAGARVSSMDNTIDLLYKDNRVYTVNNSKSIVDPIIGADVNFDFSKSWFIYTKAAIGGFGLSSKYTSLFAFTTGYRFSEHWNTSLGYKYLYTNYDKDNLLWKMSEFGFLISLGCSF